MNRKAVYAGSFDPITNGHLWMIREGGRLFDELVVAIGVNPDKKCMFDIKDRLEMIAESLDELQVRNVSVASFERAYLIHYAERIGAGFILRGIRNEADYAFERGMRYINAEFNDRIQTVFMMPPREYSEISSSFVKGLIGPAEWECVVRKYVPSAVYRRFAERFGRKA